MELRHLRYLVVIAQEENFHRAAEKLHVSQSPLSRQMQDLETEMGLELFERCGRGVKMTAAGRLFSDKAKAILAGVNAAVAEAQAVAEGRMGTITIGFETGTAYFGTLATIVANFRKSAPQVNLQLMPMSSAEQWEALHARQIALGYGYYAPSDGSLEYIELARDRLGVVVNSDHRLASQSRIKVKDLSNEPVLMQPRRYYPRLHDDIIAAVRAHGVVLNVTQEVIDLEALLTLVASGDALTFLPEKQVKVLLLGAAVWRPIVDLGVQVSDVVMWRPEDTDAILVQPLIQIVREVRAALRREERSNGSPMRAAAQSRQKRKRRSDS
jgi:DNA-binding transcriptional LysR family regulator